MQTNQAVDGGAFKCPEGPQCLVCEMADAGLLDPKMLPAMHKVSVKRHKPLSLSSDLQDLGSIDVKNIGVELPRTPF